MNQLALERRPDGSVSIFDVASGRRDRTNVRWLRVMERSRWLKRKGERLKEVSSRRVRRLERLYQHPEKAKTVQRFPRRTAEDVAYFQT